MRNPNKLSGTDCLIIAAAVLPLCVAGGMIYVALHFVMKFW
jgi:hypothetical protein